MQLSDQDKRQGVGIRKRNINVRTVKGVDLKRELLRIDWAHKRGVGITEDSV